MLECEFLSSCPFFKNIKKEEIKKKEFYKNKFCLGGYNTSCARYILRIHKGKDYVPEDLAPDQIEKVNRIIFNL